MGAVVGIQHVVADIADGIRHIFSGFYRKYIRLQTGICIGKTIGNKGTVCSGRIYIITVFRPDNSLVKQALISLAHADAGDIQLGCQLAFRGQAVAGASQTITLYLFSKY